MASSGPLLASALKPCPVPALVFFSWHLKLTQHFLALLHFRNVQLLKGFELNLQRYCKYFFVGIFACWSKILSDVFCSSVDAKSVLKHLFESWKFGKQDYCSVIDFVSFFK